VPARIRRPLSTEVAPLKTFEPQSVQVPVLDLVSLTVFRPLLIEPRIMLPVLVPSSFSVLLAKLPE